MRILGFSFCIIASLAATASAVCAPKISTKSTKFDVSGATGAAILQDLDRRGPKHGFMTRAIAQTRYTMNSEADWKHDGTNCVVTRPLVRLDITYIYPNLAGPVPPALRARWHGFMASVKKHEETHGRIARDMAVAAEAAIGQMKVKDGKSCGRFHAEMKRKVASIVAEYEQRQRSFDAVEHKDGGHIQSIIKKLTN
ncbi:MAG: DUF922 domain-containing protein [Mesorhizobium sp.]|nr:DUF922 domain-containing protein [Mesorhizobium sp.]